MASITNGLLKQGIEVKTVAIATAKHPYRPDSIPDYFKDKTNFEAHFIDTSVSVLPAFLNLFNSNSYNIERFWSQEFADKLVSTLQNEQYDVIHLESLFVAPYIDTIRKHTKAPIVLRAHNVEHIIWERLSQSGLFIKRAYLKLLAKRLKKYEVQVINQVDGIAAITEDDKQSFEQLGALKPIEVFPVGVDSSQYNTSKLNSEINTIFHLGSMDWTPNREGVEWFLSEVWPQLSDELPQLKFHIAGRKMPDYMKELKLNNVIIQPDVPSAIDFINSKDIMVVPMLSGGGMRVKIIEGMALGKTIITTSIGAEGIEYTDGENILIANEPHEFIDKLKHCISNPQYSQKIGSAARKLITDKYDNKKICGNLSYFYRQLIAYQS